MSTRRVYIGQDGGAMRIRASASGYDAKTGPLDGMLFDADAIPCKIVAQGSMDCPFNPYQQSFPRQPQVTSWAHGIAAGTSFVVIAVGYPYIGRSGADTWAYWGRGINSGGSNYESRALGNSFMDGRYCGPFSFDGDFGTGQFYWGDWTLSWDATNISVSNNLANSVRVRWMALEL